MIHNEEARVSIQKPKTSPATKGSAKRLSRIAPQQAPDGRKSTALAKNRLPCLDGTQHQKADTESPDGQPNDHESDSGKLAAAQEWNRPQRQR